MPLTIESNGSLLPYLVETPDAPAHAGEILETESTLLDASAWVGRNPVNSPEHYLQSAGLDELTAFDEVNLTSLSPEMILALAERRLSSIDRTIMSYANEITERDSASKDQLRALELLHDLSAVGGDDGHVGTTDLVGGRSPRELVAELEKLGVTVPMEDGIYRREALEHAVESVNAKLKSLNSDNEMTMLRLQDAMQNRTALINLSTNVLNTMHEAEKNIIGNLR